MTAECDPESVGLSDERLGRFGDNLRSRVDRREIPGAVVLVARRGRTAYFKTFGFRDREAGQSMEPNAVFRIASLTKPITSLAAMMLVEQGALYLGAPLSEYLPQFKSLKVAKVGPNGDLTLVPPRREATIHDLLRHTSGFAYGWTGNSPVKRLYQSSGLASHAGSAEEYLARVAELPLEFELGTTWTYSISADVLGHVVEMVTGVGLDQFIRSNITEPLGMSDTGFWVDNLRRGRVAEPQADLQTGRRPPMLDITNRPSRFGGGGAMVSTAEDYCRFCQLMLNGGVLDGVRLVSRKTIELMTANHLPLDVAIDPDILAWGSAVPAPLFGAGFGLGFAVRTSIGRAPWHGSVGAYEWVGSSECVFLIDPREQLVAVTFMQAPDQLVKNMYLVRALTYQALVD